MATQSTNDVIIREARKEDMGHVYKMIRGLAEFEKMEDSVKLDTRTLEIDGFEKANPAFKSLVAETKSTSTSGIIVGHALYFPSYSSWLGTSIWLEDLYVQPEYRRTGIGLKLFRAVAKIAYETASKRLAFHVLSWNPAAEFYKKIGAIDLTGKDKVHLYRVDEISLKRLLSSENSDM